MFDGKSEKREVVARLPSMSALSPSVMTSSRTVNVLPVKVEENCNGWAKAILDLTRCKLCSKTAVNLLKLYVKENMHLRCTYKNIKIVKNVKIICRL